MVHVPWDRVPAALVSAYIGKEGIPTVAYKVTVRHDRWIMAASQGFAGSWNDKTIVHYDTFVSRFRTGDLYGNVEFEVQVSASEIKKIRGLYLICDGGYHKWRCMQCPFPEGPSDDEKAWSKQLTSLRKDVECVFGILKQRFRILKRGSGVRKPGFDSALAQPAGGVASTSVLQAAMYSRAAS